MSPFYEVAGLLEVGAFLLPIRGTTVAVRRVEPDRWNVHFEGDLIGSFRRLRRDRATWYEGEVASEPCVLDWVSDEVPMLVARMLDAYWVKWLTDPGAARL